MSHAQSFRADLLELTNQTRASLGLQPPTWHDALGASSDATAQWLFQATTFSAQRHLVGAISPSGWEWRAGYYEFFENHQWSWGYPGGGSRLRLHAGSPRYPAHYRAIT